MTPFTVRYMFLEPRDAAISAINPKCAAQHFLVNNGGLGKGNFGRCVVVVDRAGGETFWAFIRTGPDKGELEQHDAKGNRID